MEDIPNWWLFVGLGLCLLLMLVGFNFATIFLFGVIVLSIIVNFLKEGSP